MGPTDKQVSFIRKLRRERGMDEFNNMPRTKTDASRVIETLLALPATTPRPAPRVQTAPPREGMHRTSDGTIYRVQTSKRSGRPYAKELIVTPSGGATFEFARGAVFKLSEATEMTLDEAKAWGVAHGRCCVCLAELTDPRSVSAGIGPTCAGVGHWTKANSAMVEAAANIVNPQQVDARSDAAIANLRQIAAELDEEQD